MGKILDVRKIAGVKDMTNIMSGFRYSFSGWVLFDYFSLQTKKKIETETTFLQISPFYFG